MNQTKWNKVTELPPPEDIDLLVWTGSYMIVSSAHYYSEKQRKDYADMAIACSFMVLSEREKLHYMNCRGRFIEFGTNHYFDDPKVYWAELPSPPTEAK